MGFQKGHAKKGGRRKGVPNKATAAREAEVAASGLTPLEFMLEAMRDPAKDFGTRLDAAKSAAPYIHPKLSAVEHSGTNGGPIRFQNMTDDQLAGRIAELQRRISERRRRTGGLAGGDGPAGDGEPAALSDQ